MQGRGATPVLDKRYTSFCESSNGRSSLKRRSTLQVHPSQLTSMFDDKMTQLFYCLLSATNMSVAKNRCFYVVSIGLCKTIEIT